MAPSPPSRDQVLRILGSALPRLREEFSVAALSVFGSVVRDDATAGSDVDILVEFNKPIGLIRFGQLEAALETLIGREVDLVEPAALHPALKDQILSEARRAA
ncbi:MAG: nucleotidyltransferase family protein [Oligoflexia bacterium]|nr:nucleotidyltransferase family protein [Oligoflexia bacterium]